MEGIDYVTLHKKMERKDARGASFLIEYHLSIGMAKELSMAEHNEKGKQAKKLSMQETRIFLQQRSLSVVAMFFRYKFLPYS